MTPDLQAYFKADILTCLSSNLTVINNKMKTCIFLNVFTNTQVIPLLTLVSTEIKAVILLNDDSSLHLFLFFSSSSPMPHATTPTCVKWCSLTWSPSCGPSSGASSCASAPSSTSLVLRGGLPGLPYPRTDGEIDIDHKLTQERLLPPPHLFWAGWDYRRAAVSQWRW